MLDIVFWAEGDTDSVLATAMLTDVAGDGIESGNLVNRFYGILLRRYMQQPRCRRVSQTHAK